MKPEINRQPLKVIASNSKVAPAPTKSIRTKEHVEFIVGIGSDHTASVIMSNDAYLELMSDNIMKLEEFTHEDYEKISLMIPSKITIKSIKSTVNKIILALNVNKKTAAAAFLIASECKCHYASIKSITNRRFKQGIR